MKDELIKILSEIGIDLSMIKNGVTITKKGKEKLSKHFGISLEDVDQLFSSIIYETQNRFTYEPDFLGNVVIRDTVSGAQKELMGHEAFELLSDIESAGSDFQSVLSPYFTLNEEVNTIDNEIALTGGTFNFPYEDCIVTVSYGIKDDKPNLEIISVRNMDTSQEIPLDLVKKGKILATAKEWVNKV